MAREVTLKINVEDGEVKVATTSLKRLEKAAQDVGRTSAGTGQRDGAINAAAKRLGISYEEMAAKVKSASAATKEASVAIAETGEAASSAAEGVGEMSGRFAGLAGRAGAIGLILGGIVIALVAVAAAAYKLGQQVFSLAKSFADYAREIGKVAEETGLAVETVAALRSEAEATGREFGTITNSVNRFREQIGKAAAGSEDARRMLNTLGIDGQKAITDIDGAFKQAVSTIANAKNPVDQIRLAYAAFGTDGAKILPFIRGFGGDIDALKKKAEELGIQISGKNVQAADAFNRAYSDMQKAIRGLTDLFGSEFLPIVTQALRDFTGWLQTNKDDIKSWATWSADWIQTIVDKWGTAWDTARKYFEGIKQQDAVMRNNRYYTDSQAPNQPRTLPKLADPINANQRYGVPTTVPGLDYSGKTPDIAAQIAAFEEQERRRKAAMEDAARQAKALAEFIRDLEQKNVNFGDTTEVTATRVRLLAMGIRDLTSGLGLYALQVAAGIDQKKKDAEADKERQKALEDYQKAIANIRKGVVNTEERRQFSLEGTMQELNQQIALGRELNTVEKQTIKDMEDRRILLSELAATGADFNSKEVKDILATFDARRKDNLEIVKTNQGLSDQIKLQEKQQRLQERATDIRQSLEDEIVVLSRGGRELSRYEELMRTLERDYAALEPREKQRILDLAKQADLLEELNRQHEELKDFFSETFSYVFEGDFQGAIDSVTRRFRQSIIDDLSGFLATEILGFDPNSTDNPVAKPIVGKLTETNTLLRQLVSSTGQVPTSGGSIGNIISAISGGGTAGSGGIGPGGTPYFNPNGRGLSGGGRGGGFLDNIFRRIFGGGQAGSLDGIDVGSGGFDPATGTYSNAGGGGGLFGSLSNGIGTIGSIGVLAGGLIGGRVGSAISSIAGGALAGLALGAKIGAIGGPIGAVIGAGVGFLTSILGGLFSSPKRKRDKNEKIPALNKGFNDAFAELRKILEDIRFLRVDPDEALSRANEVRSQMAGGFGIQFESKKYRKQAQATISRRLTEADVIIAEIKAAAAVARGAADRSKRILPEFAGGHYFADLFKPNGLLPGAFDARDNIFAMISRGEMVLNPRQQGRVRALAGFDVFAGAGIPNYPNQSASPKLATGGIAGTGLAMQAPVINLNPNFTLHVEGVTFEQGAKAWVESDGGRRTLVKIVREERKNKTGI